MILLIGFPKSGTMSFQVLFQNCGYKSFHWQYKNNYIGTIIKNNKQNKRSLLYGFDDVDCITQMDVCMSANDCYWPQIIDYKQLYYENTNAIFILNKREPNDLLRSFKQWGHDSDRGSLDKRLYTFNPELIEDKTDIGFVNFVNNHYNNVECFFSSVPNAKFIVYDLYNDNIDKLKLYIDLKNQTLFPKVNVYEIQNNTQNKKRR
jgi:hypothetical protein